MAGFEDLRQLQGDNRLKAITRLSEQFGASDFAAAVRDGLLTVESLTDDLGLKQLRHQVVAINSAIEDRAKAAAFLGSLPEELAIVPVIGGKHDVDAAIERLKKLRPLEAEKSDEAPVQRMAREGYEERREAHERAVAEAQQFPQELRPVVPAFAEKPPDEPEVIEAPDGRFASHDGYLFAVGFTNEQVVAALADTRKR